MIKIQAYYEEEVLRQKLEMSISVQRNCYHNESDKPYPSEKYPIAVLFWSNESQESLNFHIEVNKWCDKKSIDECKLREHPENSNIIAYEVYFDKLDTFRNFLLEVVKKYDIEEEKTPFSAISKEPTNILPEYLLQQAQKYFREQNLRR